MSTILDQFNALSSTSQYLLSNYFIDQLKSPDYRGNSHFFVRAADLKSRLFEVVFTNPEVIQEPDETVSVSVKIQLSHLVIPRGEGDNFELLNTPKMKGNREHEHNRGHYASLKLGAGAVALGLLQQEHIEQLVTYAYNWEANGESNFTAGEDAAKERVWLSPKGNKGYICFQLSERQDTEGNLVPSLENFTWTPNDFTLIGKGIKTVASEAEMPPTLVVAAPTGVATAPAASGRKL